VREQRERDEKKRLTFTEIESIEDVSYDSLCSFRVLPDSERSDRNTERGAMWKLVQLLHFRAFMIFHTYYGGIMSCMYRCIDVCMDV
jgi:hypothetical protein